MLHRKTQHLRELLLRLEVCLSALAYVVVVDICLVMNWIPARELISHFALLPILMVAHALILSSCDGTERLRGRSPSSHLWLVVRCVAGTVAAMLVAAFLFDLEHVARRVMLGYSVLTIVGLLGLRALLIWWYFRKRIESRANYLKVLVVGAGPRSKRLRRLLLGAQLEWGVEVVGCLDPGTSRCPTESDIPVLGTPDQISTVLRDHVVDEVILALPRSLLNDAQMVATACDEEGVRLRIMADLYDLDAERAQFDTFGGIPMLEFQPVALDETKLLAKRMLDLVFTLAFLPVLLPLFGVIAAAIALDSRGPVFFVQERVGLNKRRFPMFKFRSMVQDAEARMAEVEHLNEADGPNFKISDDPRITRVGRFLRRTSLDELPQLINVLLGDMSLVGPRPMSVRDVNLFDRGVQRRRFSVRPGLTCLWQVSGRSNLSFERWLQLDLQYIDQWSLWLDFKILIRTVPAVVAGTGGNIAEAQVVRRLLVRRIVTRQQSLEITLTRDDGSRNSHHSAPETPVSSFAMRTDDAGWRSVS